MTNICLFREYFVTSQDVFQHTGTRVTSPTRGGGEGPLPIPRTTYECPLGVVTEIFHQHVHNIFTVFSFYNITKGSNMQYILENV